MLFLDSGTNDESASAWRSVRRVLLFGNSFSLSRSCRRPRRSDQGTIGIITPLLIRLITGSEVFIDPWVCVGALSFSAVVGLLSGLYPHSSREPRTLEAIRER